MMQDNAQLERREAADRSSSGSARSGLPPHPGYRVAKDHPQSQPPANTESFTDEYGDDDIYLAYAADPEEVSQEENTAGVHADPPPATSNSQSANQLSDQFNTLSIADSYTNGHHPYPSSSSQPTYTNGYPQYYDNYNYNQYHDPSGVGPQVGQGWDGTQIPSAAQYAPSMLGPPAYDPLLAAASDVLGSSLPPPVLQQQHFAPDLDPQYRQKNYSAPAGDHGNYYDQSAIPAASHASTSDLSNLQDPSMISLQPSVSSSETDSTRPSLRRSGTTGSVSLGTRKTKAVDLSAPPYTKEYVDEYRQRIKNDPDPEAHFQYAKYLIDAAKKIGSSAPDQRAVKKYREMLIQESLKVIRKLATQGETHSEAQFFLANCHGTGMLGLQVDHERAYHLYLQAAKQNHAAASYRVAVCNEIGAGTKREPPRAFAFYRKAASLGDTPAMYKLGMVLLTGALNQPRNPREAVSWLRRAAEQADEENPHALHELGLLHEKPDSQIVPHDPVYAKSLFTRAAQLGYTQSQYKLGQCYEYGAVSCPVDPRRSIAWYTRAAEKGNSEAELALSGWYLTGSEGVLKQSDSEAYLWARRAANKGLSKAEYAVGYYAEIGIGVKPDIELAKRWYMRAAAQGNKRAMNRLTEIKRLGNKRGQAARPTRQQAKDECVIS
ncbi:HCP-like protein [Schizopora paradoxa]|uniref:HCP-like protein n=1 Tax=Schizopora paradoxa TaxID=27342 RepID=A0A0H2RZA7_9AGAM|nr:HCP-like protein [Schizopora paradoxa]